MRCPSCLFEGNPVNGRCARCGYELLQRITSSSSTTTTRHTPSSELPNQYTVMRGDTLSHGRYRILNQISLPGTQQKQGKAWSALDVQEARHQVVIREVVVPQEIARSSSTDRAASEATQRLQSLGQYAGFPQVTNFFGDKGAYFIVLLYPEGESLATLLQRQGGALPEPMVAEYGYQLCGLLALLADQQPPVVHGSINPDTIIINEGSQQASLIHLPIFHPDAPSLDIEKVVSGYYAPEQVRGEVDPGADLYALAATMHHCVTGYDPNTRLTSFHPPARRLNPAVTVHMELILARQLSLSKAQRYAHPAEMQKDLGALIASYPAPAINEPLMPAAESALPQRFTAARTVQKCDPAQHWCFCRHQCAVAAWHTLCHSPSLTAKHQVKDFPLFDLVNRTRSTARAVRF